MKLNTTFAMLLCVVFLLSFSQAPLARQAASPGSFLNRFDKIAEVASTVPGNGDQNPYGVAIVKRSTGSLVRGNILVSNFNNSGNLQGTGTTIVQVAPNGAVSVFAQLDPESLKSIAPDGIGLTTALVALRNGWVIVGSLPTSDGTSATARAGSLLVLNNQGEVVESLRGSLINGPWDMTAFDAEDWAILFVSNVLNGTVAGSPAEVDHGTVVRIVLSVPLADASDSSERPTVESETVIGSGFAERTDVAALVIGPTGLGLGSDGRLYIADTLKNRIQAINNALFRTSDAGQGETVFSGGALNGPLGVTMTSNNHILTVNAGDGNMVEISPDGAQLAVRMVDATGIGAGTLFGLAALPGNQGVYFVNDGNNTLSLAERSLPRPAK